MDNEQIKEITITMLNKGYLVTGRDNEDTAKKLAVFINTLKQELKEHGPLGETLTPEEIAARIGIDIPVITSD